MRVYSKLVINIETGKTIHAESYEYEGPVALADTGSPKVNPRAGRSAAGQLITSGGVGKAIQKSILQGLTGEATDAYTQRAIDQAVNTVRGGYGARGLASSGIAQAGEAQAASDIALQGALQKQQFVTGILGTGSSSPTPQQQQQPRGFLGLK